MKKSLYILGAGLMTLTLAACSADTFDIDGEGTAMISATFNSDVKVVSRSMTADELAASCIVWIDNDKGVIRKYKGIDNIPAEGIVLNSGSYLAEAWAGDSVSASFDAKYYKGSQDFVITDGQKTQVNIVCTVANTVASVVYEPSVDDVLSDYTMTVEHTRGSLTFEGRDDRKGYFMMPSGVSTLHYTLTGKKLDGTTYTRTGDIPNVQPATEYVLTVKCSTDDSELGGGYLTIEIDAKELTIEDKIEITTAPRIIGQSFTLSDGIRAQQGTFTRKSVWVIGSTQLQSVVLNSSIFTAYAGLSGTDIDILSAQSDELDRLSAGGITVVNNYDSSADTHQVKISFETALLNQLTDGEYTIDFTATDVNGRTSTAKLVINVSDAPVIIETADAEDTDLSTYATRTTLVGTQIDETATNIHFEYRAVGTANWTSVAATTSRAGVKMYASVTGLEPATKYEYRLCCDAYETSTVTFQTEAKQQLENASFENWTDATPMLLYGSGQSMYWDSGNHGSSTMGKNVTTFSTDYVHDGTYSAKLASQFVGLFGTIGKFAAGNCFTGKYLATDGMDGVLGWGRPFTSRPVKLRGYVHYSPVAIDYVGDDAPADLAKGTMDQGIVYIALLDDHTESYDGETWACVIKTKSSDRQLFDKTSSHVIAYGEKIFDATSSMVEFEITLDYARTDLRPTYILVTCAASRGGDYFTGGAGSVMYVDDLQLVYE